MLVYLSGPMSKYSGEGYNYDAFDEAAATLRANGYDVLNPAETAGGITHLSREKFLEIDTGYVQAADAICLLPEWEESAGAKLEFYLADQLSKPAFRYCPHTGMGAQVKLLDMEPRIQEMIPGGCSAERDWIGERDREIL